MDDVRVKFIPDYVPMHKGENVCAKNDLSLEGRPPTHMKNSTPTRQVQILGDFFWGHDINKDFVQTQVLPPRFFH
jgi:hypothetical protein